MEVPKDLIVPILLGKVTAIFKLFGDRHELCGERNLSVSRKSYAIADIESTRKVKIDGITEEDLRRGNFKNMEDFKRWWFDKGYKEHDPINVIYFEILRFKPYGKYFLKRMGKRIPRIKGD
jgi:hypothetical protein